MKDVKKDIIWRIKLVYLFVLLFIIWIIYNIIVIQFVDGEMWRQKAENLSLKYETVEAVRGNIISSDSNLLATSIPIFDVKIDLHKSVISKDTFKLYIKELCDSLSELFPEKSADEFKQLLLNGRKKGKRDFLIKRNITYPQLKRLRTFPILKKGKYKGGLIIEEKDYRKMPFKMLASRTIGYKNIQENLYVGLEGAYSKDLEGVSGKRLIRKIANGIWRPIERDNQIEPENGKDIISTIDINIQDVAENALMKCLDSNEADHGCAVLMEVSTGYIKAIANLKRHKDGSYGEDINYALWESAEPGSTFKLASLIAVLEDGKYDTNEIVNTGVCYYADRKMEDSHEQGYGNVSVAKAFKVSSNVGISQIVFKTFNKNPQKYIDILYNMSLQKPLGVELKGEGKPYIKSTKDKSWSRTSLPWMSIGYELQITPLQTLSLYNAIANNGKMVKPQFVKEILQTGKVIRKNEPVIINKSICSENTLKKVRKILEGVVEHGTAKNLFNTVYKIAGKTGTAKIDYGINTESNIYRASFVGYFPADKPKYSCIVVVNNPKKGKYYGGAISAPVFKEIADKVYATQLDIHQDFSNIYQKIDYPIVKIGNNNDIQNIYNYLKIPFTKDIAEAEYLKITKKDTLTQYQAFNFSNKFIPDFIGMGVKDAIYIAEKNKLKVKLTGKGKVINQSIEPGSIIEKGQQIQLTLSYQTEKSKNIDDQNIKSDTSKILFNLKKEELKPKNNKKESIPEKTKTDKETDFKSKKVLKKTKENKPPNKKQKVTKKENEKKPQIKNKKAH